MFQQAGAVPYAAYCSDPCDGRTQGTPGMFDSLAYRNDAASVFRRQARSIPTAQGVLGVATCDKGLPALMMALASFRKLPCVLVPGGVTLPLPRGKTPARFNRSGALRPRGAQPGDARRRACQVGVARRRLPFFGTAASPRSPASCWPALPHSALAQRAADLVDIARRAAKALMALAGRASLPAGSSPKTPSTTRWSSTRRSADRRT